MLTSLTYFPVIVLITANIIVGVYVVDDYGESVDEENLYIYAENSLGAYSEISNGLQTKDYGPSNHRFYGPAYLIAGELLTQMIQSINNKWLEITSWHLVNFLSFQFGLFFFYSICKKLMNTRSAFGATILFSTQPLIWGQAFINSKDIPFLAFFLAAIGSGLSMVYWFKQYNNDDLNQKTQTKEIHKEELYRLIRQDWIVANVLSRKTFMGLITIFIGLVIVWILGVTVLIPVVIRNIYYADPSGFFGELFNGLFVNALNIPVNDYIQKGIKVYNRYLFILVVSTIILVTIISIKVLPMGTNWVWKHIARPFWGDVRFSLSSKNLLIAGVFLGLCSSVRVIGPVAGILVSIYFWLRLGRRAIPAIIAYFGVAMVVSYITWPFLWAAPISRYIESFFVMAEFPWDGKVLFNGVQYFSNELPRSYLPMLLTFQFTEPVLALFSIGLIVAINKVRVESADKKLMLLVFTWLFVPIILVVLLQPNLYNNFRQLLFIIPPIFIFCGLTLEVIFKRMKKKVLSIILLIIIILPGLFWTARLHPYEYVYYNSLVGGSAGAFRRYTLDYWATSLTDAARYINSIAPQGSRIVIWRGLHQVQNITRDDLIIKNYNKDSPNICKFDYAILLTRNFKDLLYPDNPVIYSVSRDGAVFAVVKELTNCN